MTAPDTVPIIEDDEPLLDEPITAGWAKKHLFSNWYNSAMTVIFGLIAIWAVVSAVRFLLAAEYEILKVNLELLMLGRYPRDELWRVAVALIGVGFTGGVTAGFLSARARAVADETGLPFVGSTPAQVVRRVWPALLVAVVCLLLTSTFMPTLVVIATIVVTVAGYLLGRRLPVGAARWWWIAIGVTLLASYLVLAAVPWEDWGGLLINIFLTITGIALAFPFGLLLALGRRSTLPAFRWMSVSYIELIRGVPLITLLLMGIFALGFFVPEGLRPGNVTRVLVAIVLFEAAYIAEVVRGGLQSLPKGQTEAGQALGMSPWKITRQIVLPQALRATIPAMVGQFISLFKDTTLVALVGLFDLLGTAQNVTSQPEFFGRDLARVTLPFAALIFWAGSYMMSRESRRLEKKLGVGER